MLGVALTLDWLRGVALQSEVAAMAPEEFRDHDLYVHLMQTVEAHGGGTNVSFVSMLPNALAAPEYRLLDYMRWFEGASRGSGPMWPDYLARNLFEDVPRMPLPMLLISGDQDMNTPVPLVQDWFESVEAPRGKRIIVLEGSGHAPFLTDPERFVGAVRSFGEEVGRARID